MVNIYNIRPKGFNVGNDVIFVAVQNFLRQAFSEGMNIISLPATSKWESHRKGGLTGGSVYEINQFGDGVVVGGGNLFENGDLQVDPMALRALRRPMMILSVSRGRIFDNAGNYHDRTDVMDDATLKRLNDKADISLSRDFATAAYAQSLGSESIAGGCPTLFLNEAPLVDVPMGPGEVTDALISIRTPTLMSIPVDRQYAVRDEILEIISKLKSKGYKNIKFLCHDHRDIPFAASFSEVGYLFSEDVHTYLCYLKNTKLNVTYRLHSFLPCISLGTPAIKISYDERAVSMMETVGLDDWNINMMQQDLLTEFEDRLNNLDRLEQMKDSLRDTTWADLHNKMTEGCKQFADAVRNKKRKS